MLKIVLATRNAHKVQEIKAILDNGFDMLSLADFPGAPETVEDASTFAGNATKKAVELAKWLAARHSAPTDDWFVLADDSGLEVDALNGAPGVHSARFAALDSGQKGNSPTAENNAKLLRLLKDIPDHKRTARFRCVIAFTPLPSSNPKPALDVCYLDEAELGTRIFEGRCEGRIISDLRGQGGFGYDPLFIPEGYDRTFGELPEDVKNRLSHRAGALQALKAALKT